MHIPSKSWGYLQKHLLDTGPTEATNAGAINTQD